MAITAHFHRRGCLAHDPLARASLTFFLNACPSEPSYAGHCRPMYLHYPYVCSAYACIYNGVLEIYIYGLRWHELELSRAFVLLELEMLSVGPG